MPNKHNLPAKRQPRHGIYSWVNSKKIPSGRAFQAVRRELGLMREELAQAHGGEKITPDAEILVDSVIEALGVQKLLGLYVRKYGVVDGQAAKRGRLELSPILAKNWISYGNTVRQALLALRELDKGGGKDDGPDLASIVAEYAVAGQDSAREATQAALGEETPADQGGGGRTKGM